jgi:hypothetical protein
MAFIQSYYGHLYSMQNNSAAAHAAYIKALDLFERLGMRREANKVRARLETFDEVLSDPIELPQLP